MTLPRNITDWPDDWRVEYQERLNICEIDGRCPSWIAASHAERHCRRLNGEVEQIRLRW